MAEIVINGKTVPVTGTDAARVVADPKFLYWVSGIDPRFDVRSIEVGWAFFIPHGLLFAVLNVTVYNEEGRKVPGIVFLRGDAVAVLVVLEDGETGEKSTVLTRQARFPAGAYRMAEIPAGMLDGETGEFRGKAADELREETGLDISAADQFLYMGDFYPSPGGCDEKIRLYVAWFVLTGDRIRAMQGQVTGAQGEQEHITLKIVPLSSILYEAELDPKAQVAYARYLACFA